MLIVSHLPALEWHLVKLNEAVLDIEIAKNPNVFCNATIKIRGAVNEVFVVAEMSLELL